MGSDNLGTYIPRNFLRRAVIFWLGIKAPVRRLDLPEGLTMTLCGVQNRWRND